ncbi:hypothetical protein kac65v162_gp048 [Nodularia phage vB_NspS-kac65v162]|uniref:Uncharacterized protein n=3 Tax=Ravarandavirus kac65v151 TaxID=2845689 RepID=A0A482MI96_9CAUD|nr:hypothetical protein HWC12_gp048 [Nodularia phage vB_NspS-kac65v151]QBQ73080.1 hypothetical protein kac65v151_gp048 [Nodularia phage vB_NspS-kac65v151]QBQ73286.1 hypothetical protein kac65v161_gp048 [Nodularia phage vB_NspS-kac65v161]QBQ73492.1 hypothetical protein kac65v162_gp048 [Nodularia phage vB_NspS-kac65v162]
MVRVKRVFQHSYQSILTSNVGTPSAIANNTVQALR